jgi:hypothetical protein
MLQVTSPAHNFHVHIGVPHLQIYGIAVPFYPMPLLERDGVHHKKILARHWLRRIATKILTDCFSKIPANQLWQSKK